MTGASIRVALLAATLIVALPAFAADEPDVASFPSPTRGPLTRLVVAAAVVSLLGWGLATWTRRRNRLAPGGERIEVVARRSLGTRHHVAIVDAGGRRILVGFAGDRITPLADLTDEKTFQEELARELPSNGAAQPTGTIGQFEGLDA
jgi:flagellar biogenesis protein FliO